MSSLSCWTKIFPEVFHNHNKALLGARISLQACAKRNKNQFLACTSFSTYLIYIHTYTYFADPIDFFASPILQKTFIVYGFSLVWFLCWFFFAPFWSNQWITKWWAKLRLECLLLFIFTNAKFIVICKPRTLNDGRWRLIQYRKRKKALLLSSSHFYFIGIFFNNLMASLGRLKALLLDVTSYKLNNCSF